MKSAQSIRALSCMSDVHGDVCVEVGVMPLMSDVKRSKKCSTLRNCFEWSKKKGELEG